MFLKHGRGIKTVEHARTRAHVCCRGCGWLSPSGTSGSTSHINAPEKVQQIGTSAGHCPLWCFFSTALLRGLPDFCLIDFWYLGIIMSRLGIMRTLHISHIPLQHFATTLSPKTAMQHKNGRFGRGMMFRFHFAIFVVGEVVFLFPMAIIRAQATQAFSKCTNKAMEKTFLQPSPQKIAWKRNLSWQHSAN